jgi:mRNA (2'-O-methyladenosine-N6-)-methyltransferase
MAIRVDLLSKKGFCFLWVLNSIMDIGFQCLNKWGYEYVECLTWLKTGINKLKVCSGFYFLHSTEICLVGYKCQQGETITFNKFISNNVLIEEARLSSQKPECLYTLIE